MDLILVSSASVQAHSSTQAMFFSGVNDRPPFKKGGFSLYLREDKANCVVSQSFCVALLSFRHVVLAFNVFTLLLVFVNTGGTEGPLCGHHFGLDQRWRVLSRGEWS